MSLEQPLPRRQKLVNKVIQGGILKHTLFYWCVYHVILWHGMFLYHYCAYQGHLLAGGRPMSFAELYSQFTLQNFSLLVVSLAILPLVAWDVVQITHRVAGPLVAFSNALRALTRGEQVRQVRIRKGDYLTDFQQVFNTYLQTLPVNSDPAEQGRPQTGLTSLDCGPLLSSEELHSVLEELRCGEEAVDAAASPDAVGNAAAHLDANADADLSAVGHR